MMNEQLVLTEFKQKSNKVIEYVRGEIVNIRGGKVSSALVEGIVVDTYQGRAKLTLMELATITTDGPLSLLITPFDYDTIKDIEKALIVSPLHLIPRVDNKTIRLQLPPLSEEQRVKLVKVISQKIEEGRVRLRMIRDEVRRKIKLAFEEKSLSEDQKFRQEKDIDKLIQEYSTLLDDMKEKKTKEIMEV